MAQPGIVTLGSSFVSPALTDWLDNGDQASWLTLDNRLPVAIGVSPAWAEGSPDLGVPIILPALRRTTVPIDPTKGVQVQVLDTQQLTGSTAYLEVTGAELFAPPINPPPGGPTVKIHKRSCPYLLHDGGGAPSDLLYPPETWLPTVTTTDFGPGGGGGRSVFWVGTQADIPNGLAVSQQLAYAPADTAIMAATFTLLPGSSVSQAPNSGVAQGFYAAPLGDLYTVPAGSNINSLIGDQLIFGPSDQVGSTVTVPMLGCSGIGVGLGGFTPAADVYNVQVVAWLGVPPG